MTARAKGLACARKWRCPRKQTAVLAQVENRPPNPLKGGTKKGEINRSTNNLPIPSNPLWRKGISPLGEIKRGFNYD